MPAHTIEVPPDQHDDLLRVLFSIYAVKADALHHATETYLNGELPLEIVLAHRSELAELDGLLDQLGWRLHVPRHEPAGLTGSVHLLAEVAFGAFSTAVDELDQAVSTRREGDRAIDAVDRDVRRLTSLFALVRAVRRPTLHRVA